ncbi:MAG: pyridoxamine 5'-phosphate oxidase family protein [Candidatus Hodarchaeales archaeon]|jgi:hypothetical protein
MNKTVKNIPDEFKDLIEDPVYVAFTTMMPGGYPQTTLVWCDYDGQFVRINTMKGFQKERNMRRNSKVSLLAYKIKNPLKFIEIRGEVVEMTENGAMDHLNHLSELYTGKSPYFGELLPKELEETEFPVLCKILPKQITTLLSIKEKD